jgi:hypothetical protein
VPGVVLEPKYQLVDAASGRGEGVPLTSERDRRPPSFGSEGGGSRRAIQLSRIRPPSLTEKPRILRRLPDMRRSLLPLSGV